MNFGFEPSYTFLAFLFVKKFVYLELLALLALLRLVVGGGWSRLPAALALALALAGIATVFAPAAGLNSGPVYVASAQAMNHGAGMAALLVVSGVFLVSSVLPGRRWRWIDAVHLAMVFGLLCLWGATMFF